MINRYQIEKALEKWRDDCEQAGIDSFSYAVLYDDNLRKDLAREILIKVRECGQGV